MSQITQLVEEIRKTGAKLVLIQLPAGLRVKAAEITDALEEHGIASVLSFSPCYGACDIADEEAKQSGCDLIVHIGHSKFYRDFKTNIPVLYFPWTVDIDITGVDFSVIKEKRIGLLTTVQHLHELGKVRDALEQEGKTAVIGGQVLGCWFDNAEKIANDVDAFLYVGSGRFHPTGLRGRKIYALDLERREIEEVDRTQMEKRRYANIFNAKDARTFAILTSTKKGQHELLDRAGRVMDKLEKAGKTAFIVVVNEINDLNLGGIKADAFVNTACPRIVDDHFSKPIINAEDVDETLK